MVRMRGGEQAQPVMLMKISGLTLGGERMLTQNELLLYCNSRRVSAIEKNGNVT